MIQIRCLLGPDKFDYHVTTQDAKNWAPKIIKEIK
jgi:adenylylsulfate kinase